MNKEKSQFAKNLQHLRKSLGLSRSALAERLYTTKSVITKLERDEYPPDTEKLTTFSLFFQIPSNYLLNEDLSDYNPKYENLSMDKIKWIVKGVIPFISSETALQDQYFKEAYEKFQKYFNDCLDGKPAMTSLFDSSMDLYYKSWDENGTPEAFANLLCIILMMCICAGSESLLFLYQEIYSKRKDVNTLFNNHYYYNNYINDIEKERNEDRIKRKDAYKEAQVLFCDGIDILKRKYGYVDLGDYLFALLYVFDIVDNSFDQQMNVMIGIELLRNYEQQGNRYVRSLVEVLDF